MRAIRGGRISTTFERGSGMRLRGESRHAGFQAVCITFLAFVPVSFGATFHVINPDNGSWSAILSSVGHIPGALASADIVVAPANAPSAADWRNKVRSGTALILEGSSPLAASFGFHPGQETASVIHLVDVHNPTLPVIWNKAVEIAEDADSGGHPRVREGPLDGRAGRGRIPDRCGRGAVGGSFAGCNRL